jgi:hypothetical protein
MLFGNLCLPNKRVPKNHTMLNCARIGLNDCSIAFLYEPFDKGAVPVEKSANERASTARKTALNSPLNSSSS